MLSKADVNRNELKAVSKRYISLEESHPANSQPANSQPAESELVASKRQDLFAKHFSHLAASKDKDREQKGSMWKYRHSRVNKSRAERCLN